VKPLRLLMVARRFWPRVGGLETRVAQLACGLADLGVKVSIVSARWHPHWPEKIDYHGIPVVRLAPTPRGPWSTWRWTRVLGRWLRQHAHEFDVVCAWGLLHEARTALDAVGRQLPVALVPERTGWHGDCFRQVRIAGGHVIKRACVQASALLASSPAVRRELEAAGYPHERICDVPFGTPIPPPRTGETQCAARAMLAESSPALQLSAHAPLAVSTSRLETDRCGELLIDAWSIVAREKVAARLWLAGETPLTARGLERIAALGLIGRTGLLGMFDDVQGLLAAADVHVAPAADGSPLSIVEAMAAGIPCVAVDVPVNRWLLGENAAGLLVPLNDSVAFGTATLRLLGDTELASRLGMAAWQRAQAEFDLTTMVQAYLKLFERLRAGGG
jgi:glycosyltransferase involved in cell wall biosynthesis